jgi:hypothetical protein
VSGLGSSPLLPLGEGADGLLALRGAPWTDLETQGGRLTQQSVRWPFTFRASGLVIRTHTDLLVSGASVDLDEEEWFFLEIEPVVLPGPKKVLAGARPCYSPIQKQLTQLTLPPSILVDESREIEIGIASCDHLQTTHRVMWVAAKSRGAMLFMFADAEIPLDVFLTTSKDTAALARTVLSTRATAAGFACRRVVLGDVGATRS